MEQFSSIFNLKTTKGLRQKDKNNNSSKKFNLSSQIMVTIRLLGYEVLKLLPK